MKTNSSRADHDIAIIGLGAVLPPTGQGTEAFAEFLETGESAITQVPETRWLAGDHFDSDRSAPDKSYSRIGGFVRETPFNSFEFRIPPKVAQSIDRVQSWALLACREALTHAGLLRGKSLVDEVDKTRIAVIFANSMGGELVHKTAMRARLNVVPRQLASMPSLQRLDANTRAELIRDTELVLKGHLPEITEDSMAGELANCVAGRVAGAFDLRGPGYTVDAACAGSLAAFYNAVLGLRAREFDYAVVGGVDSNMGPESYVKFSKIGALSADGTRPFDAGANGFVMGEGAAVFIMRRLSDALRAGDRICAVIRGVGASSDGRGKGITAPNPRGQRQAVESAFADAGLRPRDVNYVECHGTSTPVGDYVEATTLASIFADDGVGVGQVAIGSVKSQIGHLKGAAGAAGLMKVVLGMSRGLRYPSINVREPNPEVGFGRIPLRIQTELEPWEPVGGVRRAGVSAFGFGGTNFHVLVEGNHANLDQLVTGRADRTGLPRTAVIGADTSEGLVERLPALLEGGDGARATAFERRVAVVEPTEERLALARTAITEGGPHLRAAQGRGVFVGQGRPGKVGFLFPGQGSQYAGMLADLTEGVAGPEVAETFAEADAVMTPLLGRPLSELVFGDDDAPLRRTEVTQPAVLTADVALSRVLAARGIRPDGVMGHSLGEYSALVCAGALSFGDALTAVSARGREMARVSVDDHGTMASVFAPGEAIEHVLEPIRAAGGYVVCANRNSSKQTVIAGATASVDAACQSLEAQGVRVVRLPVSAAFHTRIVEPAQEPLRRVLRRLKRRSPRLPVYKNIDGTPYPMGAGAPEALVDILGAQVGSPVEFIRGLETMWADGFTHFVEVGPKQVLCGFVRDVLGERGAVCFGTNHPKKGGPRSLSDAFAALAAAGVEPDQMPPIELEERPSPVAQAPAACSVVISGASIGLPGASRKVFDAGNLEALLRGESLIDALPDAEVDAMVGQNVVRLKKSASGGGSFELLTDPSDAIHLVGRGGRFDPAEEFGLDSRLAASLEGTAALGVAAGIDALHDACLPLVRTWRTTTTGGRLPTGWALPTDVGDETGIIFASSFFGQQTTVDELQRKMAEGEDYRYPRNMLIRSVVGAHAQLAQLLGARGPNTLVDAACASTSVAVATGADWIRTGRCRRVIVVGADDITNDSMAEWFVTGFLAAGAASTGTDVKESAIPFDRRRAGMICGMGAVGLVLEAADACAQRGVTPIAELVADVLANSAFHATRLDEAHVSKTMKTLIERAAARLGTTPEEMGSRTLFMSHETYTPARGGSASAEVAALRAAFGGTADQVLVANTKGFTGHPMAAGIEETVALKCLQYGIAPPIANLAEPDEDLMPLNLSVGGAHKRDLALRLAAGFGSQLAMLVLRKVAHGDERVSDPAVLLAWARAHSGKEQPVLEVVQRTLRIAEQEGEAGSELQLPLGPHRITARALDTIPQGPSPAVTVTVTVERRASPSASGTEVDVAVAVTALVAERTGYPPEMLDPALDLEADLGIDTVKQAEVLAELRERYQLDGDAGALQLTDYPTLGHVIGYVQAHQRVEPGPVTEPPEAPEATEPTEPIGAVAEADVAAAVTALVADRTGYPPEMLDPALDLEADLGIDTVKQAEVLAELRERYALPADDQLQLKDYPTLGHVIAYVQGHGSATAPTAEVPEVPEVAEVPEAAELEPTAVVTVPIDVAAEVTALLADRTGYPPEMLDPALDLEADLGIDTVKQAEVLAELRERYALPENDGLQLKDYPTLGHVIAYVQGHGSTSAPAAQADEAAELTPTAVVTVPIDVAAEVTALLADRTGYPPEMLDPALDLEADLGIDTVKQAEVLAELRERYTLPENDGLQLKDYPTLGHVIAYVQGHRHDAPRIDAPEAPVLAPADVAAEVTALLADRTGYPPEMLDPALDLEADLGIDTVKQAEVLGELRERYDLPANDGLQLKDYPTLGHVIAYVTDQRGAPAEPVPAPVVARSPVPDASPDVAVAVVALIAERTGYPAEQLDPALDLEADLGIDTVKQAEVMGELRERFELQAFEELNLKDYPTVAHIIAFVRDGRGSAPVVATEAAAPTKPTERAVDVRQRVAAEVGLPAAALSQDCRPGPDLGLDPAAIFGLAGEKAAVAANATIAELQRLLSGATPPQRAVAVPAGLPAPAVVTIDDVTLRRFVWRMRGTSTSWGDGGRALRTGDRVLLGGDDLGTLQSLTQALDSAGAVVVGPEEAHTANGLIFAGSGAGLEAARFLLAAKSAAAGLRTPDGFVLGLGGRGIAGAIKSLRREWPETGLCKAVIVGEGAGPTQRAATALDELVHDPAALVVRHAGGARWVEALEAVATPEAVPPGEPGVWVVSGGAGGITAEIIRRVAARDGGTFHLLGRTVLSADVPEALPAADSDARRLVMGELMDSGIRPTPLQVLSEVKRRRTQRAIGGLLDELRALPRTQAHYHSADVCDAEALKAALSGLERVDVLVHAAGMESSRPLDKKDAGEIQRVIGPKVDGLEALVAALEGRPLGAVVTFGSIAGRFGNASQTDYAAANEAMAERLVALELARPGLRTLQLDWTAWEGAGMATRGSVAQVLSAAGIGFLDLERGAEVFRRLVLGGERGEIVVDRGLGLLEPRSDEPRLPVTPTLAGIAGQGERRGDHVVFQWPIDASASWMDDHRIAGVPVLPGVMGLEAFSKAACALAPGAVVRGFDAIRFATPLKLHGDRAHIARVEAIGSLKPGGTAEVRCRLLSRHVSRQGAEQGPERLHFEATVVLGDDIGTEQPAAPNGTPMGQSPHCRESIYDTLFHGSSFQLLTAAEDYADGFRAAVDVDRVSGFGGDVASAPLALESLFQVAGFWEVASNGSMGLPSAAKAVRLHGVPSRHRGLEAVVTRGDGGAFDAILRDDEGFVWVELDGYQTATATLEDQGVRDA